MAVIGLMTMLFFSLFAPAGALAATYGTWWPQPGKAANSQQMPAYQAQLEPFNSDEVAEMTTIGCVLPNGMTLTDREEEMLRNIFANAGRVYNGTFKWADNNAEDLDDDRPGYTANGGYGTQESKKQERMRWFLEDMVTLIQYKEWAPPEKHIELEKKNKDTNSAYSDKVHPGRKNDLWIDVNNDEANPYDINDNNRRQVIVGLITKVYDAPTPIQLYTGVDGRGGVPAGCDLGGYTPKAPGGVGDFFDDPFNFVSNLIGYVFVLAFGQLYNIAYGPALQYSFWTPHTERGDTLFSIATNCDPKSRQEMGAAKASRTCSGSKPLGFDKLTASGSWQPGWLNVRSVLQWLVSGSYFLLLFTAAVVFMFRGTASRTFNVLKMVPRLIISIIFTLFSSFIIGAMITTSNVLVQAMFDPKDHANFSAINAIMQNPSIAAGREDGLGNLFDLVVIAPSSLFVAGMAAISFIRQILLIALVILTPVASFCLIIDKWRHHFNRWFAALLSVIALPVIMGLILNIGLRVNPLIASPTSAYGKLLGMLGVFLLVLTLWFMFRISRSLMAAAANSKLVGSSVTGSLAGWGASKLGSGKLAGALGGYAGATALSQAAGGKLVPADKVLGEGRRVGGATDAVLAQSGKAGFAIGKALTAGTIKSGYNLATNTPKDRIESFMERRKMKKSGGYELTGQEAERMLNYAREYAGIDEKTWRSLDAQTKADFVKSVAGYEQVHLGNDGRMFVRESADQYRMRSEGARQAARADFYGAGANPVMVLDQGRGGSGAAAPDPNPSWDPPAGDAPAGPNVGAEPPQSSANAPGDPPAAAADPRPADAAKRTADRQGG